MGYPNKNADNLCFLLDIPKKNQSKGLCLQQCEFKCFIFENKCPDFSTVHSEFLEKTPIKYFQPGLFENSGGNGGQKTCKEAKFKGVDFSSIKK